MRQFISKPIKKKSFLNITISTSFSNNNNNPTDSSLNILNLPLNPYLRKNLTSNHIYELKKFQHQVFMESKKGKNCFVNSCTGSGKTLAYLLPVLDGLLTKAEARLKQGGQPKQREQQHGAIILTLNKQLCLQIYRAIRQLDPLQLLDIKRLGPISHYIPIINLLATPPKTAKQAQTLDTKINDNLVKTIKWPHTDILISTPHLLLNLMEMSELRNGRDEIKPSFVVVDEADLLLEIDKNLAAAVDKIMKGFGKSLKKMRDAKSEEIRYFVAASSFPSKMSGIPYNQALNTKFNNNITQITGQLKHQIPQTIDLFFIQISKMPHNRIHYLKQILKSRQGQRIIIFCNTKKSVTEVTETIKNDLELECDGYHASLDSNERSLILNRFESGKNKILVSSDLGARGLDFTLPVQLIIEYEMAENVTGFINRVGRTGRNGVQGQVITMVLEENQQLFKHIEQLVGEGQGLDEVFSRKRSYRKLYKDKNQ